MTVRTKEKGRPEERPKSGPGGMAPLGQVESTQAYIE